MRPLEQQSSDILEIVVLYNHYIICLDMSHDHYEHSCVLLCRILYSAKFSICKIFADCSKCKYVFVVHFQNSIHNLLLVVPIQNAYRLFVPIDMNFVYMYKNNNYL